MKNPDGIVLANFKMQPGDAAKIAKILDAVKAKIDRGEMESQWILMDESVPCPDCLRQIRYYPYKKVSQHDNRR